MSEGAAGYNWERWRRAFDLPDHVLWNVPDVFPSLSSNIPDELGPPLTVDVIRAIINPASDDAETLFQHYLECGELAAASAVMPLSATDRHLIAQHQGQLAQRREMLELQFNQASGAFSAAHNRLVGLGSRPLHDEWSQEQMTRATSLRSAARIGPAIIMLEGATARLRDEATRAEQYLAEAIERLRSELDSRSGLSESIVQAVENYLVQAEQYQRDGINELATASLRRGREVLETGVLQTSAEPSASIHYQLRPKFPDRVQARHIKAWIEQGVTPSGIDGGAWSRFCDEWLPRDWQPRTVPDDPAFSAIERLARSTQSPPFSQRNTWSNFLKDFFDLLGRRDHQPREVDEHALPIRMIADGQRRGKVGFWLGRCDPELAFRGTFIDPDRTGPLGLPLVLWHRPREGKGPRPSNLGPPLERRGLRLLPLLVLANEPVDPEDRRALQRASPSAALLDEPALLRIILSHTALPDGFDPQPIRQLHFASAVSAQLPDKQASPFTESGAASGVMFFGRNDVLQALQDPNGPTILYGGRRLGKSSILHQLRRQFVKVDPARNVALYVDCGDTGMSRESILQLVRRIASQLRAYDTRPSFGSYMPEPQNVPEFLDALRTLLNRFPQHRLLLLLDEADTLCAYLNVLNTSDTLPEQLLGWGLRSLVAEFRGRFDVRFAGFQEIHRTTTSPGGPFFNFRTGMTSMPLKVFEPNEAIDLLVTTLRNLAVEFENHALVDRVLEFSGRHPALLQECGKLLYEQVRLRKQTPPWRVTAQDIDTLMRNPSLRKSVVTTIHLNVSRPTRAQRILALLLYLWVQQIMAPEPGTSPRETRTARDLFDLVEKELGSAAGRQLDVAAIEAYLGDLVVLGVLEQRGNAYAFAYRAFAMLLYHDYFSGGLTRATIIDQWDQINQESATRRIVLPMSDGRHTLSPLTVDAQERLASALGRMPVLLMGPTGSGLSITTRWAGAQAPPDQTESLPEIHTVALTVPSGAGLRDALADAIAIDRQPDWIAFSQAAEERMIQRGAEGLVTTVLIDSIDALSEAEDLPLFLLDAVAPGDEHLFSLVGHLTRKSRGRVRFLFSGGLPTARLWADYADAIGEAVSLIQTERLAVSELTTWLETSRLIPTHSDVHLRIAQVTGGDWRLLSALRGWLWGRRSGQRDASEIDTREVELFAGILHDPTQRSEHLPGVVQRLTDPTLCGLRIVARAAQAFGIQRDTLENWREACLSLADAGSATQRWSPARWDTELRALVLLREIREVIDASDDSRTSLRSTLVVDPNDPWLELVRA